MVIIEEVTRLGPDEFKCRITRNNKPHFVIASLEGKGEIRVMTIKSDEPGLTDLIFRSGEYGPFQWALWDLFHGRPFPLPRTISVDDCTAESL